MNIQTWGNIRHLYFVERLPKKAIARQMNLDPKTVRRALKKDHPDRKHPGPRPSKLLPFKDKIAELLAAYPRMTAVRIREEITKAGYLGGITILRNHLRDIRPQKKAFLHIQTLPGEEAQVDWAYAGRIGDRPLYCFLMVLSFSRMLYIEFFPSQITENFLAGHLRAFHYFQGIPKKIRYDNLKSVVVTRCHLAH